MRKKRKVEKQKQSKKTQDKGRSDQMENRAFSHF